MVHLIHELCFAYIQLLHYHNCCRPEYRRERRCSHCFAGADVRSQPTLQCEQKSRLRINKPSRANCWIATRKASRRANKQAAQELLNTHVAPKIALYSDSQDYSMPMNTDLELVSQRCKRRPACLSCTSAVPAKA